jgi:predicted nucleic acid-binding protein
MFVIDASVAAKWFITEADSAAAIRLKNAHIKGESILLAPDLFIYEVANTLLFSNLFTPSERKRCLEDLYSLEIDLINPSVDLMLLTMELASTKKIAIYDASYLALAREFDIKLVTADEKLYHAVKDLHCIELLSAI